MGNLTAFDNIIEEKLMSMHTAFVAKIISVKGNSATVQPLNMVKQYGKTAQKQTVLQDVPILFNAQNKLEPYNLTYVKDVSLNSATSISVTKETLETVKRKKLEAGDVVFCVCADRDISETKNGNMATPSVARHHNQSDAVIVGILSK